MHRLNAAAVWLLAPCVLATGCGTLASIEEEERMLAGGTAARGDATRGGGIAAAADAFAGLAAPEMMTTVEIMISGDQAESIAASSTGGVSGTRFNSVNLDSANFDGADLQEQETGMREVDFREIKIDTETNFRLANLKGAIFSGLRITGSISFWSQICTELPSRARQSTRRPSRTLSAWTWPLSGLKCGGRFLTARTWTAPASGSRICARRISGECLLETRIECARICVRRTSARRGCCNRLHGTGLSTPVKISAAAVTTKGVLNNAVDGVCAIRIGT